MYPSEQKIHTIGVFQSFQEYGGNFTRMATFMTVSSLILVSKCARSEGVPRARDTLHPCI